MNARNAVRLCRWVGLPPGVEIAAKIFSDPAGKASKLIPQSQAIKQAFFGTYAQSTMTKAAELPQRVMSFLMDCGASSAIASVPTTLIGAALRIPGGTAALKRKFRDSTIQHVVISGISCTYVGRSPTTHHQRLSRKDVEDHLAFLATLKSRLLGVGLRPAVEILSSHAGSLVRALLKKTHGKSTVCHLTTQLCMDDESGLPPVSPRPDSEDELHSQCLEGFEEELGSWPEDEDDEVNHGSLSVHGITSGSSDFAAPGML